MCELMGMSFAKPVVASVSIQAFSQRSLGNADGWGLAWFRQVSKDGHLYILDAVTGALERDRKRRAQEKSNSDAQARFALLTPRERQIMALVTGGLMNKQVAGKIGISERTVKIHRGNVMRKMRTKSLADLVMIAESLGIRGKENQEN